VRDARVGSDRVASLVVVVSLIALLLTLAADASAAPAATPASPPPRVHVIDEKERAQLQQTDQVRLSLPTQSDVDAWHAPGLRVQLGYAYGMVHGYGPAFSFSSKNFILRPSVRLDAQWALGVALLYGTGPNGVRWSATAEPTFFPWRQLAFSLGLGYGGLDIGNSRASTGGLQGPSEPVSRDLTGSERLNSCTGSALATMGRTEYMFVAGPLFSSGPFVEASSQWTRCQASFGRTDPETGQAIVLSQWWHQTALDFGWWFAWR
jgi:hypothetical protein